jgi:hypothetical protein
MGRFCVFCFPRYFDLVFDAGTTEAVHHKQDALDDHDRVCFSLHGPPPNRRFAVRTSRQSRQSAKCRFECQRHRQLFIAADKKSLCVVALCSATHIVRPSRSTDETQPKLQPGIMAIVCDNFPLLHPSCNE